jgi:threonine synthase
MTYTSTRNPSLATDFATAVKRGLAQDGGLFVPVGRVPTENRQPTTENSRHWLSPYIDELSSSELSTITQAAFNFPTPLVRLDDRTSVLELFHGPTMAFKDFGARFMARILPKLHTSGAPLTILTATSGDTGAAVAQGFHGVGGVHVVVLYPSGKVSPLQEAQFTTLGGNITALEVDGTFDDCQRLVKQAFGDAELLAKLTLTSANSINIARLLPQGEYYRRAVADAGRPASELTFVVPSGNFGNLTAGLMASRDAFPEATFFAATNANDVVPQYLHGHPFTPRGSVQTLSNAMDVGDPSNFERLLWMFDGDDARMRNEIGGLGVSDADTRAAIKDTYDRFGYVADPHTATGLHAWLQVRDQPRYAGKQGIVLATAHPAKFMDVMEEVLPGVVSIPERLAERARREKKSVRIGTEFEELKGILLG